MERRKFLVGMGSLAAGSAAAMGTGAFTSVSADRSFELKTADDRNALLGLKQTDNPNSQAYVSGGEPQISIDIDTAYANGVNSGAATFIDELFKIRNQSTRPQYVWINEENRKSVADYVAFYVGTGPSDGSKPDYALSFTDFNGNGVVGPAEAQPQYDDGVPTQAARLTSGESVKVGMAVKIPQNVQSGAVLDGNAVINSVADSADLPDFSNVDSDNV